MNVKPLMPYCVKCRRLIEPIHHYITVRGGSSHWPKCPRPSAPSLETIPVPTDSYGTFTDNETMFPDYVPEQPTEPAPAPDTFEGGGGESGGGGATDDF